MSFKTNTGVHKQIKALNTLNDNVNALATALSSSGSGSSGSTSSFLEDNIIENQTAVGNYVTTNYDYPITQMVETFWLYYSDSLTSYNYNSIEIYYSTNNGLSYTMYSSMYPNTIYDPNTGMQIGRTASYTYLGAIGWTNLQIRIRSEADAIPNINLKAYGKYFK